MKLFRLNVIDKRNIILFKYFAIAFILQSCATNHSQFGKKDPVTIKDNFNNSKEIAHTFYLIGDAGNADEPKAKAVLELFQDKIKKADSASTVIFLGDNIYPNGMPLPNDPTRK